MDAEPNVRQEQPLLMAVLIGHIFDATIALIVLLPATLALYVFARPLGPFLLLLDLAIIVFLLFRLVYGLLQRDTTLYKLEANQIIVERGVWNHTRATIPIEGLTRSNVQVQQSLRDQVGGYGSLVITLPDHRRYKLDYMQDPLAWRAEIVQRLPRVEWLLEKPTLTPPEPAPGGWLVGFSYAFVPLMLLIMFVGGALLLSQARLSTPEMPDPPITIPLGIGDVTFKSSDLARSILSVASSPVFLIPLILLLMILVFRLIINKVPSRH